jgi:hypothetical protein
MNAKASMSCIGAVKNENSGDIVVSKGGANVRQIRRAHTLLAPRCRLMHQSYPASLPFSSAQAFFAQFECAPESAHHTIFLPKLAIDP